MNNPAIAGNEAARRFVTTPFVRRKLIVERVVKYVFFSMAVLMIVPLVTLIVHLIVKASASLNLNFILEVPLHCHAGPPN